ncbi:hypothetical protein SELMODRAFT_403912 [Selaginella moellendorffii]|uniref:Uncharacterized protein n=1 Tax=Selaginella moellendorffii TaxID=88036 RepID=D8QSY8_SELML|nr:hypothetical protein SELMODRAFT_403912 [Selaginella moellendorffii]
MPWTSSAASSTRPALASPPRLDIQSCDALHRLEELQSSLHASLSTMSQHENPVADVVGIASVGSRGLEELVSLIAFAGHAKGTEDGVASHQVRAEATAGDDMRSSAVAARHTNSSSGRLRPKEGTLPISIALWKSSKALVGAAAAMRGRKNLACELILVGLEQQSKERVAKRDVGLENSGQPRESLHSPPCVSSPHVGTKQRIDKAGASVPALEEH